jgi:hypothetical protein
MTGVEDKAKERVLLVLVHAFNSGPERLAGVAQAARDALLHADVEICSERMPFHALSSVHPHAAVNKLLDDIDARWAAATQAGPPFDRIIMLGYSVGSLIVRKAYVVACGETPEAPLEPEFCSEPRPWAGRVDRIVLLAGLNRGWRVSHHLSLVKALAWTVLIALVRVWEVATFRRNFILQFKRDSEFLTQLRVQWIRMRRRAAVHGKPGAATVVQLLGTIDDFVSPNDSVDLVAGGDFFYIDVPFSGHVSIADLGDPTHGAGRRDAVRMAIAATPQELRYDAIVPDDPDQIIAANGSVESVVFVLHGIRDEGYWTHRVARKICQAAGDGAKIATETSSYGYFPMLGFLFSRERRRNVDWLMDQYARALALYPNATEFHFVGHSNGTYCLADALRRFSCCRFNRVVFAGSVVRSRLDWKQFLADSRTCGRVTSVLNFVATDDLVVAGFPNLFERWLPIQRLGGAGHFGFTGSVPVQVSQVRYVSGGHGAAIVEPLWTVIADYIVHGIVAAPKLEGHTRGGQGLLARILGWFPPLAWLALVGLVAGLGYLLYLAAMALTGNTAWAAAMILTLYGVGVVRLLKWI